VATKVPRHTAPGRDLRRRAGIAVSELTLGAALLLVAAVAGLLFVRRPWENRFDVIGYSLVPARPSSRWYRDLAELGSSTALFAGTAVLTFVALWRDRARALACLAGPLCAVLVTERVAKPLVARPGVLGGDSYPSGTVTAVAALATAVVLVAPRLVRPLAALVGAGAVAAVSVAVLGLRWHFATDAAGGALVGCGALFTLDALAHLPGLAWRAVRGSAAARSGAGSAAGAGAGGADPDRTGDALRRPVRRSGGVAVG
jgi:membrane-associated phospholipid phosphatase